VTSLTLQTLRYERPIARPAVGHRSARFVARQHELFSVVGNISTTTRITRLFTFLNARLRPENEPGAASFFPRIFAKM